MAKLEKNLFKISWPIFLELLFFTLLGTIDTIMLSNYSDTAVGSVGVSNRILFLFAIVINVLALGIGVVVAQYLGAGDTKKAKDATVTGIFGNVIIGFVITVLVVYFGKEVIILLGTNAVFIDDAVTYIKIVGFSLIFVSMRISLSTAFRSFSHPRVVMYIMGVGNLVNIIINAVLIYGLFGAPSLGVKGAAIGTLVARIVMVVLLVIYTYKILHIKLHVVRLYREHLKKILYVGLPAAAENITYNIAQIVILYFINQMRPEAVIAQSYITLILSFVFIFSFAFASGNSIIVGYHIGEKQLDDGYKQTLKAVKASFITIIIVTMLLNIFAYPIISIFTNDQVIVEMVRKVIYISIFIEIGRSLNLIYISALRSAGDTIFPVIMAVASMFGVSVLFTYVLGIRLEWGIIGVFVASAFDELIRGGAMAYRWYKRRWMDIRLIED
ncbi:MATE family efflux transporter [Mycoplasmatota bacterium]|nr:MATE family efflux transporter [Mycoplasmatota bacterium]